VKYHDCGSKLESISNRGLANEVNGLSFLCPRWKSLKQGRQMAPHTITAVPSESAPILKCSPPLPFDAPYGVYRCQSDMRELIGWLRSKGVVAKTPLHTLRKQFGSEIHARYGLLAASEQLRHGGIAVTARHYIENKSRMVLGFGHLLKGERTIIAIDKEALACAAKTLPEI
jgi:hypothetical protein